MALNALPHLLRVANGFYVFLGCLYAEAIEILAAAFCLKREETLTYRAQELNFFTGASFRQV